MTKNTYITRRYFLAAATTMILPSIVGAAGIAAAQTTPVSAGPVDPNLLDDLVAANRILAIQGVLDGFGHVSVRHNRDANRFLLSRSLAPALVTRQDIIEFDLDGNPVNAQGRSLYSERFIHGEIYKMRPDVKAVVHNHSPSLIPYGVTATPLRPVYHMAAFIGDRVPVFDIRKGSGMTDMLVNDAAKGKALAQTLGDKTCVLMRGHGVAVVGPSIPFAVGRSIYLELDARVQSQSMALGGSNITFLDPQEAKKVLESGENRGYERPWELWKKTAEEDQKNQ